MARTTFGEARGSSIPLIGRRLELAWLRSRRVLAADGYAHLVLVEGDAGIGKTRLVEAILEEANAGTTVVRGRCYEHLDFAYLPLRETLFAPLAAAFGDQPGREADAALLRRVGALDGGPGSKPTGGDADDRAHTQQLLALTHLVLESALAQPTVLFIDDLDWADTATVDLLRHLLFRVADAPAPLLVIATSRGDTSGRAAWAIARLRTEPRVSTLLLHALSEIEATELARQLDGGKRVEEARRLAEAGNGNPLLIEALVHQSRRGTSDPLRSNPAVGVRSSHPVTDAVGARLATLDADARTVARVAALMEPDCPRGVLASVTASDVADLDAAIAGAIDAGVLVDDADERIRFSHPMFAHILVDQMTGSTRRELHARIAAVLLGARDRGANSEVRALAHHLIGAGDQADPTVVADVARQAGDEAMALTAWPEAARCFEAAIAATGEMEPGAAAALHRSAALAHRGDMNMREAVRNLDAAIARLEPDGDPATLTDLHIWRLRCAVGSQEMLEVVRDRERLEALVEVVEPTDPELAAEGLVELAQSRWVAWDMAGAAAAARRAMALADRCGSHRAYVRATTTLCVPQWAEYDLQGSWETLEAGIARARAANDEALLVGGPLFRAPLVLTWLGRFDDATSLALEGCAVAERTHYPLEEGLPLAALTQMAVLRGRYDEAEQHAHQALLVQRLSGYHWAAGLFLPALVSGHLARGRYDAARDALDTWAETGDSLEQQTIALFRRLVTAQERGQAVEGAPMPRLPRDPVIGLDAWAAACVELARWEGSRADVTRARDLLAAMDARGGVVTSSLVTLVPRALGVAHGLLGDDGAAVATLRRALDVAARLGAEAEGARTRVDLATVLARSGDRRESLRLLDDALPVLDRLGMEPDAEVAAALTGAASSRSPSDRSATSVSAVIFFSDVVDSTRLTEELGAVGYRIRARMVEDLVTSAIVANGGTIVTGISLGDGFIGLFNAVDQAVATALHCAREVRRTGLHLHLALHRGEILLDDDRIYGGPVNYSARICDLSGPDEILISDDLRRTLPTDATVAVVDRGQHRMKGFEGPQTVYALFDVATELTEVG